MAFSLGRRLSGLAHRMLGDGNENVAPRGDRHSHRGAKDNIFPHHECEIAQSRCATGQSHFAKYWIHPRYLMVEGEKMSKSKGNFFTVRDVLAGKVTGRPGSPGCSALRTHQDALPHADQFYAKRHSRLGQCRAAFCEFGQGLAQAGNAAEVDNAHPVIADFLGALSSDLNISAALAVVHTWIGQTPDDPSEARAVFDKIDSVLGIADLSDASESPDKDNSAVLCNKLTKRAQPKITMLPTDCAKNSSTRALKCAPTPEGTVAVKKLA